MLETGSDGESNKNNNGSPAEGSNRPKRLMKTPFQLETLEKAYKAEMYPSEVTRVELSERLGLSDRQLQMWFCHRRLKDKKEGIEKKAQAAHVARKGLVGSSMDELKVTPRSDGGLGSMSRSRSGSGQGRDSSQFYDDDDVSFVRKSPLSVMQQRVMTCVEAQLREPLREDGPILGIDFDELPPGAFGAPLVMTEHWGRSGNPSDAQIYERSKPSKIKDAMMSVCEPAKPSTRADAYRRSPSHYYDSPVDGPSLKIPSFMQGNGQFSRKYSAQVQVSSVDAFSHQARQEKFSSTPNGNNSIPNTEDVMQIGRKRKSDEIRIGGEVSHEKRIRKELEKEDLLRRKREEQMRKEMEKQDRERRKEEERMFRENQRREEKYQREERRELERREKFLQKELLKAERMKQLEDLRRDKEAARKKVAMERAALRRIAKESLELIEDERLELMELAALSKGLPSIISLDYETLQNLESFRDSLCAFPLKSVQLKRPFSIKPWIDSEDNIGNLLMVWRFCITFSDVLGLWPFTLDEFVQAFHDYDSRLLTEIHIALLKLIIKDIEEGARTPCGWSGTNQYTVANPDGGHPQIVEGAFVWGFDIRNWQNHLNPLTWPEILRQFALSAGFGPKMRKESTEQAGLRDNNEVKGCEDKVSMLRNGSAVENAVAVMQAKRFSLQQRSRHRLTPGTVKFAAYHVLCLEGSKGQTVLELADKIQKFGLRDLSKSKTPDASVSVALSRDPILFERIAPSTYCVRPAFRKDPANAEVILEAAREKIQKYGNGFLAEETVDDAEKDDNNSESDVAEGPEIDELGTPSNVNKTSDHYIDLGTLSGNANDISHDDATLNLKNDLATAGHSISQVCITGKDATESDPGQGFTEIDESKSGEPWVQGLTEGEYGDLCVEERLNALVALIGVVNEGNIICAVLEDRLDAANALKKQMWTEAQQLGKRRMKEESSTKFHNSSLTAAADGSQSPLSFENRNNEVTLNTASNEQPSVDPDIVQKDHNHFSSMASERSLVVHDTSITQITLPIKHGGSKSERSRLQLKSFIGHRAEEMHVYRSLPLGQDRRRNRYWQFVASASRHDPGSGRIFVELRDGYWKLIDSAEAFDALLMSLDTRGLRESHLHIMLQQSETSFKENVRRNLQCFDIVGETGTRVKNEVTELGSCPGCVVGSESPSSALFGSNSDMGEPSSSFRIELGKNETEKMNAFKRYQALQAWMWKQCFNSSTLCAMTNGRKGFAPLLGICDYCCDSFIFEENKCPSCHRTFSTFGNRLNYLESVIQCEEKKKADPKNLTVSDSFPFQIRLIKALLAFLEVSVPSEAFQSFWTAASRSSWGLKLQSSSSIGDLLQILTQFEGVIKKDFLSSDFETTTELLGPCAFSGKAVTGSDGSVPQLPWIPQTTAAVALRLLELDSSIFRTPNQKSETNNATEVENFTKLPTKYRYVKDVRKVEPTESPEELTKSGNWAGLGTICGSSRRRRVMRNRCGAHPSGRLQKKNHGSRSKSARRSIKVKKKLTQVVMQHGERTDGQLRGDGHGPGTVRRRKNKAVEEMLLGHYNVHLGIRESPRNSAGEWVGEEIGKMQDEDADNSDSSSESESDGNADATRYEDRRREPSFTVSSNRSTWEMSDEDADVRDINGSFEDHDNLEEDVNMNDGFVGNSDESSDASGDHNND